MCGYAYEWNGVPRLGLKFRAAATRPIMPWYTSSSNSMDRSTRGRKAVAALWTRGTLSAARRCWSDVIGLVRSRGVAALCMVGELWSLKEGHVCGNARRYPGKVRLMYFYTADSLGSLVWWMTR